MLLVGADITSSADELRKIKVDYLYDGLCHPKPDIEARVRQLRVVRNLDTKQYSVLKRRLPYVVCGMFNPCYRRTENFAYIEYFIVDIDKLSEKQLSVVEVRGRIQQDGRVVMCFLSPGEDGLKVLFRLKERCYDERYLTLIKETPELLQYVPLKHIASYLWVTPQSLSRIRAEIASSSL